MLREITLTQFLEWLAYAELEPFGDRREDYRNAAVVQAIWESERWANSTREHPYEPRDIEKYRIRFGEEDAGPKRTQTWQEQLAIAHMWVRAFNSQAK